jgi:hypothetical protein
MKHILGIDILYVLIGLQHIYPPLPLVTKEIVSFIPHNTNLTPLSPGRAYGIKNQDPVHQEQLGITSVLFQVSHGAIQEGG